MSIELYPLKFNPIFKEKIWGGDKIKSILKKDYSPLSNCGESWEISCSEDDNSIVADGSLKGLTIEELIKKYKSDLVGKKVYEQFGDKFPLLIKYLDANDDLSIQVHPNDEMAKKNHNSFGKTEMWYVLQADENAKINVGFNKTVTKQEYLECLNSNTLDTILNFENVKEGDVYFLPAGRVHYIGKGCLIAEIQQTSDITYRIYDFDRVDANGNKRELHTDLALQCIDFNALDKYSTTYTNKVNQAIKLVHCQYFKTNIVEIEDELNRNYAEFDSFVILMVLSGSVTVNYDNSTYFYDTAQTILLPACLTEITIHSSNQAKLLEVWV